MSLRHLFLYLVISVLAIVSRGDALVPCPDCGREVSPRALMCPGCGCRGEVIEQVARAEQDLAQTGCVLRLSFGAKSAKAYPVEMEGRRFVVAAFDAAIGGDRIELFDGTKNVPWRTAELAVAAPLIRLQIEETNLVWTVKESLVSQLPENRPMTYALTGQEWQPIQPREMKHLKILERIRDREKDSLPYRTHPYFKYLESQWRKEPKE